VVGRTVDVQQSDAIGDIDTYLEQHFCQDNERVILRLNDTKTGDAFSIKMSSHFLLVTKKITTTSGQTDWEVFAPVGRPRIRQTIFGRLVDILMVDSWPLFLPNLHCGNLHSVSPEISKRSLRLLQRSRSPRRFEWQLWPARI